MNRTLALLLLSAALFAPARAEALEVELELGLAQRFILQRNRVEKLLRYDEGQKQFDTRGYLNPTLDSMDYGVFAAAALQVGLTRWFSVGISVDSGLLMPTGRVPREATYPIKNQLLATAIRTRELSVFSTEDSRRVTSSGQPIGEAAEESYFIRQAFLRFNAPETEWFTADLGRRLSTVGDGLIYDDSGLGVALSADLELLRDTPVRLGAQLILPARGYDEGLRSPLVELKVDYVISLLESVGIFGAYFHDGDDSFGRLFSPLVSEAMVSASNRVASPLLSDLYALSPVVQPSSRANLGWLGATGNKIFGESFMLQGTFVAQLGRLSFTPSPLLLELQGGALPEGKPLFDRLRPLLAPSDLSVVAFAVDVGARYMLRDNMVLGSWFLFLSGAANPFFDQDAGDSTYNGFLSVVPYLTRTNIFFSGGLNETFTSRQATTAGLNGHGVIAGALTWEWEPWDLKLSSTVAALSAAEPSHNGGRFYGVEVDLDAGWAITSWLGISVEYDFLVPGSFFSKRDVIQQLMVGVDLKYEYAN